MPDITLDKTQSGYAPSTEEGAGSTTKVVGNGLGAHLPQEVLRRNIGPFALLAVGFNIVSGGWGAIGVAWPLQLLLEALSP